LGIYYVATFHSVSQALGFEKLLKENNLPVRLIPVPRVISHSCGMAAKLEPDSVAQITRLSGSGEAKLAGLYRFTPAGKTYLAEYCAPEE